MMSLHLFPLATHSIPYQVHTSPVRVVGFSMTLSQADLETLDGLNWLNDQVSGRIKSVMLPCANTSVQPFCMVLLIVNFYFNLIAAHHNCNGSYRVHSFNSFFYPKLLKEGHLGVKRWTNKVHVHLVTLALSSIIGKTKNM